MKIWFVTDSGQVWDRETLRRANTPELGGSIGGAESMTVGLAHHLSNNHDVTMWATKMGPTAMVFEGVHWRPAETGLCRAVVDGEQADVCISVRQPSIFNLRPFADWFRGARVLWAQDIWMPDLNVHATAADTIIYVSDWHRRQWEEYLPGHVPSAVTPIALDPAWIAPPLSREERRHTYIYASRPERGLQPLLAMWGRIRGALPAAKLLVTGYDIAETNTQADQLLTAAQAQWGGIEVVRQDDKIGLFKQLARASLLLYPGEAWFAETNGSICSQAMAAGVIPLVSRRGALPETVPETAGVLFRGDPRQGGYQDAFVSEIVRLSQPEADLEVAERQVAGHAHVLPTCSYDTVTTLWEQILQRSIDERQRRTTPDLPRHATS